MRVCLGAVVVTVAALSLLTGCGNSAAAGDAADKDPALGAKTGERP